MRDADYLRARAKRCLELAHQMSDPNAARNLMADAARYHTEAAAMELQQPRLESSREDDD
jgi:hypothetical protein